MTTRARTHGVPIFIARALCTLVFLAAACSGPADDTKATPEAQTALLAQRSVVALWLDASNPSIARNTIQPFHATAVYGDGFIEDVTNLVSWSASDLPPGEQVATIDGRGFAKGRAANRRRVVHEGNLPRPPVCV
jgi:hypothetical protein